MGPQARRTDPSIETAPGTAGREVGRQLILLPSSHVHPVGALRGLLVAILLSAPFWIALYFLLR